MRAKIFTAIMLFLFSVIAYGLFYTQIIKYPLYKELSERNRVRALPLEAPRGKVYDRNGKLIVTNRLSFDIEIVYQEVKEKEKLISALSGILDIEKKEIGKRIKKASKQPFVPVKVAEDVGKDRAIRIEEIEIDFPGLIVTTRPLRNYIYGRTFSHITGYIGKISEVELQKYKTYGYRMQDFVGREGIERSYNDYLRGTNGGLQVEVDNRGRQLRVLALKEPRPGKDVYLSIDMDLQMFCDSILGERKGVIIALDPFTGEVFSLVSHPSFDPNVFIRPDNYKEVSTLLRNGTTFPLLNRAISGTYPPGSVFKIVVAAAALEEGNFTDQSTLYCEGSVAVGNRRFHCWKDTGHGSQDMITALKNSCNAFFYQLGLMLGPDEISAYAFKFGLGKATGIDLPGEIRGLVPTPAWKRRELKEAWYKGETANYSIGQGYLLVTPIQIVRLMSVVANRGKLVYPAIVRRIEDIEIKHKEVQNVEIKETTIDVIRKGLKEVVNHRHGTGLFARSEETIISGKTGTAQNPLGKSHAWFSGFAPFGEPKICVVVFIEHGGKGGLEPARFSKKIIEEAKRLGLL